ncbi:MAG TPA: transposase, partial [Ktedonobacteraceae bacterium]|nr:transposase [Ktedonobacteraceae bacterium]
YQLIVFEDLQTANITKAPKPKQDEATGVYLPNGKASKAGLNKRMLDAGWGMFVAMCTQKAAWAARTVVLVNPKYTSQACSGCGVIRKKELSERWHTCECGCSLDRDTNAAINILRLGRSQQGAIPVEAPR